MFRLNLFIPLMLVSLVMAIITVIVIIYLQENSIYKSKEEIPKQFLNNLDEKVTIEAAVISEYINFIQENSDIEKFFVQENKEKLNNSVIDIYNRLNKNVELTHMYFIKKDGSVLLRVHDYQRDKDIINRVTFKKAKERNAFFYGLEFGVKKNYTLRVVKPWIVDGKLIGYIELGKEIDKLIKHISHSLKTEIYIAVNKGIYKDVPNDIKKSVKSKTQTGKYYIVYNTSKIPSEIESIIDGKIINEDINSNHSEYFVSKHILSDVSGRELGYFVFLSDVSFEHRIMYASVKIFSFIILLITLILIIGGYILISKKEKSIYRLTSKLEKKKNELSLFNVKLQKLFDLQKNIIVLTNSKSIIMVNQAMFDFFGYKNLDEFLKHHNCICERFVKDDNFFHIDKVNDGKTWIETVKFLSEEKRIVTMLDRNLMQHTFNISISQFEGENFIITFTDISSTMLEHSNLKKKVTHDKLTGALNREFFENNINTILKNALPKRVGFVLCDIDHFKRVNDTYGHNRGDIVLKEFTKIIKNSIRESDYLIRWGGEEFILLIKVNNIDALYKVTQHIRKLIEEHHFEEVNQITSSFGISLYIENEKVIDTLERIDKALYKAKNNGRNQVEIM
jgi:diguanylate cyclase (GGDEF)-like protein